MICFVRLLILATLLCFRLSHGLLLGASLPTATQGRVSLTMASLDADATEMGRRSLGVNAESQPRICILGGGFGGLYTALRLNKLPWGEHKPEIVLVDKKDKFAFLPLLYELAVGRAALREVAPSYKDLLAGTGITFARAQVSGMDPDGRTVTLKGLRCDNLANSVISDDPEEERSVSFDQCVVALGCESPQGAVPGAVEHALPFYTVEDSHRVKKAVNVLATNRQPMVNVVVIGGSYCGVELASNLVGAIGKDRVSVTVVQRGDQILQCASKSNKASGERALNRGNVQVMTGKAVSEVTKGGVIVEDGNGSQTLPADLIIWTAGVKPNSVAEVMGLARDDTGKVLVDSQLQVNGQEEAVYCIGDLAAVKGEQLPSNAQVAMQQSDVVAWNIWSKATGKRKPLDFSFTNLGEVLSLGRLDASVSALQDRISFRGPPAAVARRAMYALRMPTRRQRATAATSWVLGTAVNMGMGALEKGGNLVGRARRKAQQDRSEDLRGAGE